MLYTTLLVAAAAFSSFASAQNDTTGLPPSIGPCCTVDPNTVPAAQRKTWCDAERHTCPELCGGLSQLKQAQTCDEQTLEFTCECKNGTTPDMSLYQQSVPGQMCLFWFDQCINATNEDREQQEACLTARDTQCGNQTIDDEGNAASSSASGGAESTASQTSGGDSPSETGEGAAAETTGAANALAVAREFGTPVLAGGLIALFGFAL